VSADSIIFTRDNRICERPTLGDSLSAYLVLRPPGHISPFPTEERLLISEAKAILS
jgi:hypothetical protein